LKSRERPDIVQHNKPKVVIVSGVHDYRTPRRGSIQALTDALVQLRYDVTFISVRFSPISLVKGDHRNIFWRRANKAEIVNGVCCYLWRTAFHPFRTSWPAIDHLMPPLFAAYARLPNRFIDDELGKASFIVIESGLGIVLTDRARTLNKRARIIYRASDALHTIGAHPALTAELQRRATDIDAFCLLAAKMAPDFSWAAGKTYIVPLGINHDDFASIGPSPYSRGMNAVTVGSMLFDRPFFQDAASRFADIQFHLIGTGREFPASSNVRFYKEMPFKATLPYIKHADFGIAAYRPSADSGYLAQSSLKLMQYEYLGIPAVCPDYAVGESRNRFGYSSADPATIDDAVRRALARGRVAHAPNVLSWEQVAERLLHPEAFADTAIGAAPLAPAQTRAPERRTRTKAATRS
jgi:2-beta-glucuronyltransferase